MATVHAKLTVPAHQARSSQASPLLRVPSPQPATSPDFAEKMKQSLHTVLLIAWMVAQRGLAGQPPKQAPEIELSSIRIDTDRPSTSRLQEEPLISPPTGAFGAAQPARDERSTQAPCGPSMRSVLTQWRPSGGAHKIQRACPASCKPLGQTWLVLYLGHEQYLQIPADVADR